MTAISSHYPQHRTHYPGLTLDQVKSKRMAASRSDNEQPLEQVEDGPPGQEAANKNSPNPRTPVSVSAIHAFFNGNDPRDITVHFDLPVIDDIEVELEEFAILRRLGNFKAAKSYFKEKLGDYRKVPYVFVQYAQMLLDSGDFEALSRLRPEVVFKGESLRGSGKL